MKAIAAIALLVAWVLPGGCHGSEQRQTPLPPRSSAPLAHRWSWLTSDWRTALDGSQATSRYHYRTPNPAAFRAQVAKAAVHYHFRVLELRFVKAPQGAPLLIVETTEPEAVFAHQVPYIVHALDPTHPTAANEDGWRYEGFYFGAQDRNGTPFVAVFSTARSRGGGQWARFENLLPYPHG